MVYLYNRLIGIYFEFLIGNFEWWCVKLVYIYFDFLLIFIRFVCIIIFFVYGKIVIVDVCWMFLYCRYVLNELFFFEYEEVIVFLVKEVEKC